MLGMCVPPFLMAQNMPYVYDVENSGADVPAPDMPPLSRLPVIRSLPDPFQWADTLRGRMKHFSDWRLRRAEIGAQIQHYEIGVKPPRPDSITASFSRADSVLRVNVILNGDTLRLSSRVYLPAGTGPFPAVIGMNTPNGSLTSTIFTTRNIARITYSHNQVTTYGNPRNTDPYYRLYPGLNVDTTGQYSAWAWGVSRIIDGLELVQDSLPIDLKHIAVTGCSYAGKMALFAGAFDERIALTIAQESGGGGATSWRYSHAWGGNSVEEIDNTDYNWFMNSMKQFSGENVYRMPEDHHELMAMVAPRALYVTANPDYLWLSNVSCHVASMAASKVYEALGIPDRFGFSVIGGHTHCALPNSQVPDVEAFVDRFLLGDMTKYTFIETTPYDTVNLAPWITWSVPVLTDSTATSIKDNSGNVIAGFNLDQNYPNPFNPSTTISYDLAKSAFVRLVIYDALGRAVNTLVGRMQPANRYTVNWTPRAVSSGVYFCRIEAYAQDGSGHFGSVKKLLYMK